MQRTQGRSPIAVTKRGWSFSIWSIRLGVHASVAISIARLNPGSFSVTGEFPTLTPNSAPTGIVAGKDGALWFTENGQDKIGRITTAGLVTEYTSPVTGLRLQGIAVAADGSLWFTEPGNGATPGTIGRLVY